MAFQWVENFQQYGTTTANLLNGAYAEVNGSSNVALVADPDPTAGGTTVLRLQSSQDALTLALWGTYVRKVCPTPAATMGVMWRWWNNQLPDTNQIHPAMVFADSNNVSQVSLVLTPTGTIQAYRGNPRGGTLLGESAIAIVANAWQRIEAKVFISATVGTVRVDVEKTTVLNLTGLNTQNGLTTIASIIPAIGDQFGTHNSSTWQAHYKDFIIWDTTGALNNDVLGTCFVYSMRPNGDTSGTWTITGGAGSAYASINETNPDDDTKYISSPWPAATADVLTLADLPASATRVLGIMALARSRKSDGGDGNLQVSMVSGASTGNGADRAITTAYTYWADMFETDPATSAAWTVSAANAASVKFNRTL